MSFHMLRRLAAPSRRPRPSPARRRPFSSSGDAAAIPPPRQRLRRSVHFVPGDNTKFLSKCLAVGADTVVLDLEDSVKDKALGRRTVREFLDAAKDVPGRSATEVLVRINPLSLSSEDWRDDLEAGFEGGADGFVVPKVESRTELEELDAILGELEKGGPSGAAPKVLLPIATETPAAVLNVSDIARGPRVAAIAWGCEDLSAELGSFGTRDAESGKYLDVFRHCRNMCLLAARAAGVQAIDGIYQDVRDAEGFEREAREASRAGFDGKLTLHPAQVPALHRVFAPTAEEMKEASEIAAMWEVSDGKGSLEYGGKMIDLPHYVRAKKVIARGVNVPQSSSAESEEKATDTGAKSTDADAATDEDVVFPRVSMGKYFEDLEPGTRIRHFLTRTVTESDNVFFTCLTLNPAPIHLDHELSKGHGSALSGKGSSSPGKGKPLFNSMFTLALLVGMCVPEATHGTTVANLGFSEVLFPRPVYPGDTLRAETLVVDRRESKSRPSQGIVTVQHVAFNQRGEVVCKATRQALMKKRET